MIRKVINKIERYIFLDCKLSHLCFRRSRKIKIDDKKVVFSSFDGSGFSDSPKYIALKLHEVDRNAKIVWLIDKNRANKETFPPYIKTVNMFSFSALKELSSAKVWVDNTRKIIYVPKKEGQFYIQTWHGGLGFKKIEQDCESQLDPRYIEMAQNDSAMIDLCISNSKHLTSIMKNGFWYSGKILQCGMAKNDVLINYQNVSRDLMRGYVPEGVSVCLYAPTFRKNYKFDKYTLDYSALKTQLEIKFGGEWVIGVRFHPNLVEYIDEADLPSDVVDFSKFPDVQVLLALVDCVITDYSSIIFDFALTNKPAFIYAPDYREYVQSERDVYIRLEDTPFDIAETNDALMTTIGSFSYETYLNKLHSFFEKQELSDKGNASEQITKIIIENLLCKEVKTT